MKYRTARRFVGRTSNLGLGLPGPSRLGIVVTYMVIREVLMLWLAMFIGLPSLWDAEVAAGITMRGFIHITNAAFILFVIVDFWGASEFS